VAVAVGVAVLLIALVTLVPFFMAALGKVIFWPSKGSLEHKENFLWGIVGKFSLTRPLWALVILAVIVVPFLSAYKGTITFNSMDELGDKYNSVKAFNLIADSFGPQMPDPRPHEVGSELRYGDFLERWHQMQFQDGVVVRQRPRPEPGLLGPPGGRYLSEGPAAKRRVPVLPSFLLDLDT